MKNLFALVLVLLLAITSARATSPAAGSVPTLPAISQVNDTDVFLDEQVNGSSSTGWTAGKMTGAQMKTYVQSGLVAFQSEAPAATTASVTLTQPAPVSSDSITVSAGSGAYTLTRALSDAGVSAGQTRYINVLWPASTNPTLVVTDLGSSATLATLTGTANVGSSTLQFVYNGTAWTHFSKGEVPSRSLYSTVLAILGIQPNTANAMVVSNGSNQITQNTTGNAATATTASAAPVSGLTGLGTNVLGTLQAAIDSVGGLIRVPNGKVYSWPYVTPAAPYIYDATYSTSSTTLSSASANFIGRAGQTISIPTSTTGRQIDTIASVTDANDVILTTAPTANSNSAWNCPVVYGIAADTGFQNAVNAAAAAGGELELEEGTFLFAGSPQNTSTNNSVIQIPYPTANSSGSETTTPGSITVRIVGTGTPNFYTADPGRRPSQGGTILYFPNQSVTGNHPAAIATCAYNFTGGYWGGEVSTTLSLERLCFRQPPNPHLDGVQYAAGGALDMKNVSFDLDFPYSSAANLLPDPASGGATAIYCPQQESGNWTHIDGVYIYGYKTGVKLGDQLTADHGVIDMCRVGLGGGSIVAAAQMGRWEISRCSVALGSPGQTVNIQNLQLESDRGGLDFAPSWCQVSTSNTFDIDNYQGGWTGLINVATVQSNVGPIATTIRTPGSTGAPALKVYDIVTHQFLGGTSSYNFTAVAGVVPNAPTVTATGGSGTSYSYELVYVFSDGSTAPGPTTTVSGPATLTGSAYNTITIPGIASSTYPVSDVLIYRTSSSGTPSTTGCILDSQLNSGSYNDAGLSVNGSFPAVATNTTGTMTAATMNAGNANVTGTLTAATINPGVINGAFFSIGSAATGFYLGKWNNISTSTSGTINATITYWNGSSAGTLAIPGGQSTGCPFTLVGVPTVSGLYTVSAPSGGKIYFGTATAYTSITAQAPGCTVTLTCMGSNNYSVTASTGTFTLTP